MESTKTTTKSCSYKIQEESAKLDKEVVNKQKEEKHKKSSMFVVIEPLLQAMLDALEARLKPNQTLEESLIAYLDPQIKTKWLEIFL